MMEDLVREAVKQGPLFLLLCYALFDMRRELRNIQDSIWSLPDRIAELVMRHGGKR